MNNSGLYFTCTIGGLSEETFAVYQFTHEEALSSLYSLTLHVAAQVPIDLAGLIYQPASFNVWADGQIQRSVSGLVESIEQGKSGFRRTHFTIVIRPQAWLLTLRQDSRIFHFKTIPDILESLFQSHNVLYSSQLNDPHLVREYVTQKRETDYAFMQRLAAEEGITFWFEQLDEENEQIFFSDTRLGQKSGVSLVYNTHPQTAQTGNLASDVRWTVRARSGQAIHKDRNYLKPAYALMHTAKGTNANDAQFAVFESYGRFEDDSPGKNFTQYRVDALQAESEIGRLKANCFAIMPGAFFSLSEHPDDKMNTQWQAIRVSHKGYCPQALEEESDQGATVVTSEVEFISAQKEWRSPWIHKPVPDATEIAEVVGPKGEEIHTNEYGCVKVFFHWNRYDAMDDKASAWVRVSNQWASNGFGSVTLPRVGDEVLITYVDGDIDRPLISGRNYNAINKPPYALPDNKTKMVWRSKSYKSTGFNEISFEDNTGKEEIFIHGQKDMNILILNDTAWDVRHDYKNKIGNNYTQEITVNSDITIKGIEKHSTEGDRFHNVNGDSHLNTGKSLLIKNGDEMSVESGSKITLSAATELTIKAGSQFITLNPAGIFTSAPMNIGSGSAGKGKPASKNLPGLLELLAAPTLTQILVTRESAPYCEECEKCKNGMCGLDGPNSGNDSPGTGGPGGFGGGSGSGGGFGGTGGFAGGPGGFGGGSGGGGGFGGTGGFAGGPGGFGGGSGGGGGFGGTGGFAGGPGGFGGGSGGGGGFSGTGGFAGGPGGFGGNGPNYSGDNGLQDSIDKVKDAIDDLMSGAKGEYRLERAVPELRSAGGAGRRGAAAAEAAGSVCG